MADRNAGKQAAHCLAVTLKDIEEGYLKEKSKVIEGVRVYEEEMNAQMSERILNLVDDAKKKKRKRKNKKEKQ